VDIKNDVGRYVRSFKRMQC